MCWADFLSGDGDTDHLKEALIFMAFMSLFVSLFDAIPKTIMRAVPPAVGRSVASLLAVLFVRYFLLPL